jgi:hypothetical protein
MFIIINSFEFTRRKRFGSALQLNIDLSNHICRFLPSTKTLCYVGSGTIYHVQMVFWYT